MLEGQRQFVGAGILVDRLDGTVDGDTRQIVDQQHVTLDFREARRTHGLDLVNVAGQQRVVLRARARKADACDIPFDDLHLEHAEGKILRPRHGLGQEVAVAPVFGGDRRDDLGDFGGADFLREVGLVERREFGDIVYRRPVELHTGEHETGILRAGPRCRLRRHGRGRGLAVRLRRRRLADTILDIAGFDRPGIDVLRPCRIVGRQRSNQYGDGTRQRVRKFASLPVPGFQNRPAIRSKHSPISHRTIFSRPLVCRKHSVICINIIRFREIFSTLPKGAIEST